MLKKLLLFVGLMLAGAASASAQGYLFTTQILANQGGNVPTILSNASITVCQPGATGVPCSPHQAIYTDLALTQPIANSTLSTDSNGNLSFYIPTGNNYVYSVISANGLLTGTFTFSAPCVVGVGCAASAVAGGSSTQLQFNNAGVLGGASGITTPDGNSVVIHGPDPWLDIAAYGGRAVSSTPATTGACTGTTSITVASATGFQVGDGVVVYGCGATETMTIPNAPTVQSGISSMLQVPIASLVTLNGASTYKYKLVGVDKHGGMTVAGPATTIATGLASLGYQTAAISTESLSGTVLTITLTGGTSLAAGELVEFTGSNNAALNGWGLIATSGGGGSVLTINNPPIAAPNGISSTGGTLTYLAGEQLTWTQSAGVNLNIVCAQRPGDGTYHVIGLSYPGSYSTATTFTDWGATITTAPSLPAYMTDAGGNPCNAGAATNDYLSTTITNIAGFIFTVANTSSQTIAGQTVLYDVVPAIKAAFSVANATSYNGNVFIPNAVNLFYPLNSYADLSGNTTNTLVTQGIMVFNETMEPPKRWTGFPSAGSNNQAQNNATANQSMGTAWPGIYYKQNLPGGQAQLDNLSFGTLGGNQKLILLFNASGQGSTISNINCTTGSASDYSGICVAMGPASFNWTITNSAFSSSGQTLVTWSPSLWLAGDPTNVANSGFETLEYINLFGRGIYSTNYGAPNTTKNVYCQGCTNPVFTNQSQNGGGGLFWLHEITNDTGTQPIFVILGTNQLIDVHMDLIGALSQDTGGIPPLLQGSAPTSLEISQSPGSITIGPTTNPYPVAYYVNQKNFNRPRYYAKNSEDTGNLNPSGRALERYSPLVTSVQGFEAGPLNTPVLAVPTPSAGGAVATGVHTICARAVGWNGGYSQDSCRQITVAGGTQTYGLSVTAVTGAMGYLFTFDANSCLPTANATCSTLSITAPTTTLSITTSPGSTQPVAKMEAAGDSISGCVVVGCFGPQFLSYEVSAPSGVAGANLYYADSTTHLPTVNPNNAGAQALARLTITPTDQDCVKWSGTTGLLDDVTGKCARYTIAPTSGDCVTWSGTAGLLGDAGAACGAGGGGLNTNMNNMANPTSMSQSLIPGAVNTVALGTAALPLTNFFFGTIANQSISGNTANLTANRVVNWPDATSTPVRDCPAIVNQFIIAEAVATGICTQSLINATASSVPSYVADSGAADVYVATLSPAIVAYAAGLTVRFLPTHPNATTTPTVNVNGLGAKTITKFGQAALQANDLITTAVAEVVYDGTDFELQDPATFSSALTASSVNTLTNKTTDCEATGNNCSFPIKAYFGAAGCNGGSTAASSLYTGTTNAPTAQCGGSTVTKAYDQFVRGNIAYINWHLPPDWNSSAATDIELGLITTDVTNGHVISFDIQTGCNAASTGAVTDDPALNAAQAASVTIGGAQVLGGALNFKKTGLTMTGCTADSDFEIAITRNNSGTDTATNVLTAAQLKFAEVTIGVMKNAANR